MVRLLHAGVMRDHPIRRPVCFNDTASGLLLLFNISPFSVSGKKLFQQRERELSGTEQCTVEILEPYWRAVLIFQPKYFPAA